MLSVFLGFVTHEVMIDTMVVKLMVSSSLAELSPTNLDEGSEAFSSPVMLMSERGP